MYQIDFSQDAERQLRALSKRDQALLISSIRQQLTHQPAASSRNRKLLRPNIRAAWELRVRDFRVLYNIDEDIVTVIVVAVAIKDRNRYLVDGEEYEL